LWSDPTLNIAWPLNLLDGAQPSVSDKDARGSTFLAADLP
jgi:dTDP-4-dehydrorhamnose 3,5-epimerase-like enzyme